MYGCETWSLKTREKRRLGVYENRVLRRIFGPKRDDVTGSGENYVTRSLLILAQYYSGDKIEKNEIGGVFSVYGQRRGVYRL